MNGQEIIARLRENEPALRARGVVNRDGLRPYVLPAVTTDAIYAF